jgi:hypothetical protein
MDARNLLITVSSYGGGLILGCVLWRLLKAPFWRCASFWLSPNGSAHESVADVEAESSRLKIELSNTRHEIDVLLSQDSGPSATAAAEEVALIGADPNETTMWDRLEFLQRCANLVSSLATLLDEVVCDAFEGEALSRRLSSAVYALLRQSEEEALRVLKDDAPPLSCLTSEDFWIERAAATTDKWLASLVPQLLCSSAGVAKLGDAGAIASLRALCSLEMRLALWSEFADANIQWRLLEPSPFPLDSDSHQLFSLDGNPLSNGKMVLPIGPTLTGRAPGATAAREAAGRGGGELTAASTVQLKELRGTRCRTLVVAK